MWNCRVVASHLRKLHVDFDDRDTIQSDTGDEHAFNENGIAVEGYQKSKLQGEGLSDLHYGVLVKDIAPEYDSVKLQVLEVKNGQPKSAEFPLPTLKASEKPVNSCVGFGWELDLLRLGARQTTAVLRLDDNVVARINGDTTGVEPDAGCVGILHRHSGLQITLHVEQLLLTEVPR